MPLTAKGEKILSGMEKEYGAKKGEEVFYASRNKGTISGVDAFNKVADMTSDDWKELRDKLAKFFKEEAREPEHKEDSAPKGYAAARSELAALGVELKWNDEWEEFTVKKKGASGTGYHTDDLQDAVSTGRTMAEKANDVSAKEDAAKDPLVGKRVKINYPGVAGHGKTGKVLGRSGDHLQIESGPDEHRNYMIPEKACKVVGDSVDIPAKIDAILKRMDAADKNVSVFFATNADPKKGWFWEHGITKQQSEEGFATKAAAMEAAKKKFARTDDASAKIDAILKRMDAGNPKYKVGQSVEVKYDIEQVGRIEAVIPDRYGETKYKVRVHQGGYVNNRSKGDVVAFSESELYAL